jgi:hypothetical protein
MNTNSTNSVTNTEYTFNFEGKEYKSTPDLADSNHICKECAFEYSYNGCWESEKIASCDEAGIIWKEVKEPTTKPSFQVKEESPEVLGNTPVGVKHDTGKARYDLIPVLALEEVAKVLTFGADGHNEAYDDENWRRVPFAERRFFSAAQRHLAEVRKGNPYDIGKGGSNCHHYACAISSLMFLLQKELEKERPKEQVKLTEQKEV